MRIGLTILVFALSACGARVDDNHTGGKTNWLSACESDRDCNDLSGAICATGVCTTSCQTSCDIGGTLCAVLGTTETADAALLQVCLPQCDDDANCSSFGSSYECISGVCARNQGFNVGPINVEAGAATFEQSSSTTPLPSMPNSDGGLVADANAAHVEDETPGDLDAAFNPFEDTGASPPVSNPHNCPGLTAAPSERPYYQQIQELAVGSLDGEPGCEGPCGYKHWGETWVFDSTLECPLLATEACDELRQQIAAYVPTCNTLDDCTGYSGELSSCVAAFVGVEYWTTALFTAAERDALYILVEQFNTGGCGTPRAATGLTYNPVACTDGVCDFESVEQCD